ncbi:MAG: ribonuclease H1 domain-containing protein [Alkalibacterium gilvum]|uniref:Ribonuclease H n=1 Tax=Alkalibacterium gilvum TaxID=1130080 RepID=A0A1H6VW14_9LACT|nr:ribonuclease H family protein [Alkalibacterium gilvum]MDN6194113.1 ribonuclease H family protein [Alkalibacterium sp.]MDN6317890.1 ribonuclease H family protein [Lactococcus lactis]MDN6294515.1 ribonuclease H family protein [Alkalibacterium sp.]MDN6398820.1 ribonuclease H family protein [Alkalibacterium sp.]SEJ06017.1 ribonuclease HI [Alkalibacterium gilvum]
MSKKYYAVKTGHKPGIYSTWAEASKQVSGFSGAQFKSFKSLNEAKAYTANQEKKEKNSDQNTLIAYVDGSFDKRTKIYSYGAVLLKNNTVIKELSNSANDPKYAESFQIAGECFGALNAIRWAIKNGYKELSIYYDYLGIEMWATGQWRANKIVSKDYVKYFRSYASKIDVSFIKVKAHTGVTYNERADELAKRALKK